ncbi:GNAT family N-acetyltransferase [Rhodococcus sp. NPDC058521]|uniref:GNAT family N-acetyltransferase n=1 Tax=Rhodococcus sp. NPDC058521 TaxID=3346536 RepID=UPI003649A44B
MTSVRNATDLHRYEIEEDGTLAGFTEYVDKGGQRIFFHTEIGEEFGGRGLASTLIREALTDAVSAGLRIVPICSFVARYVGKHDDFADSVDAVTPETEQAVKERS